MSTFVAIGYSLAWGGIVSVLSLSAFSCAIAIGLNGEVAPRTLARPKDVIKNVLKRPYGLNWIPWALNLTYEEMLEGIPGTGTRRSGWSGSLLKCNLDGVIVCKFNALCLRVAVFATWLCLLITLPLNYTAPCDSASVGITVCANISALSDFQQTTLANIPSYHLLEQSENEEDFTGWSAEYISASVFAYFSTAPGITSRLFGVVLVAWCIYAYSCVLIWNEWVDNLAMRRAYYLERDHYEDRKEELDYLSCLRDPEDPVQTNRPPFLPHPELRETVPSVCLYSVLYKLPDHFSSQECFLGESLVDKQLSVCVDFFDKCVPNQPGFSSSVAAVTILPSSAQVTAAWKKWYQCAAKLRRLRFIRQRIELYETRDPTFTGEDNEIFDPLLFRASRIDLSYDQVEVSDEALQTVSNTISNLANETATTSEHDSGKKSACSETNERSTQDIQPDRAGKDPAVISNSYPVTGGSRTQEESTSGKTCKMDPNAIAHGRFHEKKEDLNDNHLANISDSCISPREKYDGDFLNDSRKPLDVDQGSDYDTTTSKRGSHPLRLREAEKQGQNNTTSERSDRSKKPRLKGSAEVIAGAHSDTPNHPMNSKQRRNFVQFDRQQASLTNYDDTGEIERNYALSDDGMEQLSVYCREFAQSSAGCCPYGCDEVIILAASVERLKEMEEEAEEEAREANRELIEARESVNLVTTDGNVVRNVVDRRDRQLSLLNSEVDSSSDEENVTSSGLSLSVQAYHHGGVHHMLRKRGATTGGQWQQANENLQAQRDHKTKPRHIPSGRWYLTSWQVYLQKSKDAAIRTIRRALSMPWRLLKGVVNEATYAVVTFTSRQAAIAARQCLADGGGVDRWTEIEDIPVPPLADGPAWNLFFCRNFCKPVTLTLHDNRKKFRKKTTVFWLTIFCLLYNIPLSFASNLLSPEVQRIFPGLGDIENVSGILTGILYSIFFSVCPLIFKGFANFGSGATSVRQAEYRALRYYWIFILVTAFAGTSLTTMVNNALFSDVNIGEEAQDLLIYVANILPTQISETWLNWIIIRVFSTLPLTYLLQFNTLIFKMLRMDCCARLMHGGGPGGPMPFRIYVDCGTVFLCIVALAPACPLIAPAAMMYFFISTPMIRWLLIFVYRPEYDGGGLRWPLIHEIFISSLIVSQILLTTMMVLKKAYGPALMAAMALVPTYFFSEITKDRFLRSYQDAGLLQTSELDGWNTSKPTCKSAREEYRRWLVDAHKAAFVPICLAGVDNFLTMEPAVVIPTDRDTGSQFQEAEVKLKKRGSAIPGADLPGQLSMGSRTEINNSWFTLRPNQHGATYRRISCLDGHPQEPIHP